MTLRGAAGGCMPSFNAAFHAPEYHTHVTPLALSVSPIVFCVCGGSVCCFGSVPRGSPSGAGGTREGCHGGCVLLTEYPSGVTSPSRTKIGAPFNADAGESGLVLSQPRASISARSVAGGSRS